MVRHLILALMVGWWALPSYANGRDVLDNVLHCVAERVPENPGNGVDLNQARVAEPTDSFVFIFGTLGWHTTWGVLFDVQRERIVAYETFGSKGDITGAFGRMEVPGVLRRALIACDVEWLGLWPREWPERPNANPPPAPDRPINELAFEELLPPQQ